MDSVGHFLLHVCCTLRAYRASPRSLRRWPGVVEVEASDPLFFAGPPRFGPQRPVSMERRRKDRRPLNQLLLAA
jgi:hypothetical protein